MFTQDQWDQAVQDKQVRVYARDAFSLLLDRESDENNTTIIDWAIGEVVGETQLTQIEYYAVFFLVLNPWLLRRPTLEENDYRLNLLQTWERNYARYLVAILRRLGGKIHLSYRELEEVGRCQVATLISPPFQSVILSIEDRHPKSGKSHNDIVSFCQRHRNAASDENIREIWGTIAVSVNSWSEVQTWAAQIAKGAKPVRVLAYQGDKKATQTYRCYQEVYQYATSDTLPDL